MKPTISVDEARKLLGDDAKNISNEEMAKLVDSVDQLARFAMEAARQTRLNETH